MTLKHALGLALAFCAQIASPTLAGDVDLHYQAVMHVAASQAGPVLGQTDHVLGTGDFRGVVILDGGELALHRYQGWFDLQNGSGRYEGYAVWHFDDGSELCARYEGAVKETTGTDFQVTAKLRDFEGTGRYAGATGEGTFAGRRLEPIEAGGTTYLKGTLHLKLPD